ncbi:Rieske 2Fe-2S domain-containing protein [Rubellicoccus peritrichatus]|uniref:Rieske 2Fe-2S domain-containing protein n=1 Tax=Rubellicoccus peritrichatus TaxID=3080537 RepID=A0AAQ3LDA6_9BACT|nr:Rieske 2Fe-2S domain-containing protein [Puniceicoccus sp. CR14]WOO42339.1 Rieske 2Fe-2S domain-containing protein [Puniceicoccus sp. CR14]
MSHKILEITEPTPVPPVEERGNIPDIRKAGLDPDFWYPLARSKDVKAGKAHAVTFAGDPIVLVRSKEAGLFAVEDRCAHRQVPLSVGVVEDGGIRCGYHGWKFDCTGSCTSVPYLDKCTLHPNSIRSYPCRERYGLIFVFPGDAAKAETVPFPEMPAAEDPKYKVRTLDRRIGCHYSFMHENLMDMNHQFLHRRLMGSIKTLFLGKREGPNWVEVDYSFYRKGGKQSLGEKVMIGRSGAAKEIKDKEAAEAEGKKTRDIMTIRTEYPYQTLKFWTAGSTTPALDLWNLYFPVDREQRINQTYGLMCIQRPPIPFLMDILWPAIIWFTNGIFNEDKWICELEQAAFDAQGEDWNHEIFPAIRSVRRVITDNGILIDPSWKGSKSSPEHVRARHEA